MKKFLLSLFILFFSLLQANAFEEISVPYKTNEGAYKQSPVYIDDDKPELITGAVSLLNSVPQGFFGTWKVISVQIYSNNPFMFNSMNVDLWRLDKNNNHLTLTNPESGATATVTLDSVKNNTIKFVRTSDTPYEKVVETPEITLNGENFYGTDTIIISKYKNNTLIDQEMVKFKVKGIKQSGASVSDLISK